MKKIKLLISFLVSGVLLNAQTISKGPYLIYPFVNTQMTVLWQLSGTSNCSLAWGTDLGYNQGNTQTTEYSSTSHQHKFTIGGLTPGKLYYYRVSFGKTNLTGSFRAAPENSATKVSFYGWGDTRDDQIDPNKINTKINAEIKANAEYQTMILHAGDWVGYDAEDAWANQFFNRAFADQNLIMHSTLPQMGCRGNHEDNAVYYKKYFPYNYQPDGCFYSFDYGPLHISVVDQYIDYSIGSNQYKWLVYDLSSSTKTWNIILLHEPGWSAGGGHDNNTIVQTLIQPLCLKYHVSIVIGGHNHYYARASVSNIVHLTLGGGGAQSYTPASNQPNIVASASGLSYMRFDIDKETLHAYAISSDGKILDSYTLTNAVTDVAQIEKKSTDFRIFPNPSHGQFELHSTMDLRGADFEIYNLNGQMIKKIHNNDGYEKTSIDMKEQKVGIYILKTIINGVPFTTKIILSGE